MNSVFLCKRALCALVFLSIHLSSFSQGEPVSQTANSMVDLLTGDFNYSLPVMTVPGPNGENVPINFSYHGGIRMDEEASWIGLGWNYNPGEITRDLKGVPDDWDNKTVSTQKKAPELSTTEDIRFFGPLYFSNCNGNDISNKMDINSSGYRLLNSEAFSFPDYDQLHVSGPGISGSMSARIFLWGGYYTGNVAPYSHYTSPLFLNLKKIHFYFENDISHYQMKQELGEYRGNAAEYSSSTNRVIDGNCIEYYTNGEINQYYTTLRQNGFLDYRTVSGTRRPTGSFDEFGIGAFQITTPNGMVYHYSLPVYTLESEKNISFRLNGSNDFDSNLGYEQVTKAGSYAVSWKLTSVTGPDYYDFNDNGIADIGDTGYWIAYNYGKWTEGFNWKHPFFNYKQNVYDNRSPSNFALGQFMYQTVKNMATINTGFTQRYYLNSIQTATHTAYFIKEVRLDNHAVKEADNGIVPSLRLSKIVLMRNEDLSELSLTAALPSDSRFMLANTTCSPSSIQPHIGNYNANKINIQKKSIATVELNTNYGLCKMIYNNINNTFITTTMKYQSFNAPDVEIYKKFDPGSGTASSTDLANSGKLTLTSVKLYGDGFKVTTPAYLFDYNQTDAVKNPNYNAFKSDYWGYYKSDYKYEFRGRYTTPGTIGSFLNTDAWSLKKITTPLGGEILIDYESDKYEKANYGGKTAFYESPKLIFLIHNVDFSATGILRIGVTREVNDFISVPGVVRRKVFVPFNIGLTNNPPSCGPNLLGISQDDSCAVCGAFDALTPTTTGSNSSIQNFNYSYPYVGSGCESNPSITKTFTYNPLMLINGFIQGWGYIKLTMPYMYGGGVRVKQIRLRNPDENQSYINEYTYEIGVAGSEPVDIYDFGSAIGANRNAADPYAPASVVTYGKVTVRSKALDGRYNGKTEYEFDNMLETYSINSSTKLVVLNGGSSTIRTTTYRAEQIVGALGRLTKLKDYDNNNNILSSRTFNYGWYTDFEPSVTESFTHKLLETGGSAHFYTDYIKTKIKSRLRSTITYKDGITTHEEYLKFDPYTGQTVTTRIIDPSSGIREVRTQLAYTDYPGMGPKLRNIGNKNMLSIVSKQTVYSDRLMRDIYNKLVGTGYLELISGFKTTWRQTIPMRIFSGSAYITQNQAIAGWQPYKTYVFNGDANDANWREESEITLFNTRQQPIETKSGVSNRYAASKIGYNKQFALCSAEDSKYADIAFSGFEDLETVAGGVIHFGGEITNGSMRDTATSLAGPHTGRFMAKVPASTTGPQYISKGFTTGRTYRASIWVQTISPAETKLVFHLNGTVNGSAVPDKSISRSDASNITSSSWILMTLTMNIPANYVSSSGTNDMVISLKNDGGTTAYFDDFMLRPVDADMTGNVLQERTNRTIATIDNQNFGTIYKYSGFNGRLTDILIEKANKGFKIKKRFAYTFSRSFNN